MHDSGNLPGGSVPLEFRPEDVIRWDDTFERRADNLGSTGRNHIERKSVAGQRTEHLGEQFDIVL